MITQAANVKTLSVRIQERGRYVIEALPDELQQTKATLRFGSYYFNVHMLASSSMHYEVFKT